MKSLLKGLFLNSLFISQVLASTVSPSPKSNIMLSKNPAPDAAVGIVVEAACYGTNNRGTTNPLNPLSRIFIHISSPTAGGALIDMPSKIVTIDGPGGETCGFTKIADDSLDVPGGYRTPIKTLLDLYPGTNGANIVNAFALNNLPGRAVIPCQKFPIVFADTFSPGENATYEIIQVFPYQVVPAEFYGYNGRMDRSAKWQPIKENETMVSATSSNQAGGYSDNNKFLQISVALPGQDGFCGGYHSPLMFFFDETYPAFTGRSTLLRGKEKPTSWVEAKHPGYFLVNLKNANSPIVADNLFGDGGEFKNGFEVLAKLDSNHDKVIDQKDKKFKNLYLWKDENGNGKNDKGEVKSLEDFKISSIDMNFNNEYRIERGPTVFKGRSVFKFINNLGQKAEGQIFDVFFDQLKK